MIGEEPPRSVRVGLPQSGGRLDSLRGVTTFVLVHGAWHGAWCWERLVPELEARGHQAVTMDLPARDGTATFDDYAKVVVEAAADVPGEVVVVGHSMGAMTAPLVVAQRPVSALVLLCGLTPNLSGQPWDDAPPMERPGTYDGLVTHPDGSTSWRDVETVTAGLYGRCAPDDAAWVFAHLRAQASTGLWGSPYPLTEWPDVRTVAICCTDDAAITAEFVTVTCRERFGVEAVEIPGDHSPFLADPARLADLLVDLAG